MREIFIPSRAVIREIVQENSQIKTFRLELLDKTQSFSFRPGQFLMLSIPHCGEAAISISSAPTALPLIDLSIRKAGVLTSAIHEMTSGDEVGLRGPFGTAFPVGNFPGHDLLFVAGGIGLAPLKSVLDYCLFQQEVEDETVQQVTLLYGSRTVADIAFQDAIEKWKRQGVDCRLTIDVDAPDWSGPVGLVTELLSPENLTPQTISLICGPPIMIRFVIAKLIELGQSEAAILTTLERHMKCGMGLCGHCHLDGKLVCVDGPVFTYAELKSMNITEFS